jgi:hypothetical protein
MKSISYMVTATLPSAVMAEEYVAWLRDGHVAQVIAGGAKSAVVVRLDVEAGELPRVMTQYLFASRAEFERYVREVAPALRADGVKRFGAERGVKFERAIGEIE